MKVELINIHKSFGVVHANNGINLTVASGTIQGILGENGAGKSTLMKILSGFIQADEGKIRLDGKVVKIQKPSDAIKFGIGMLHQDPLDFPPMKVIDNFIIGEGKGFLPKRKEALKQFNELQSKFGFKIDPDVYVETLTVGERQQLEILRLLWLGARVLILDEPTTGISAPQRIKLFETLKLLAKQSMSVLFVSHKLEEVESLCTRVAVMRQGELVGTQKAPYDTKGLVKMMFGKEVQVSGQECYSTCEKTLCLNGVGIESYRMRIRNINLEVCKGETLGLAGMEGSGQGLFLRSCAGLIRPIAGKVLINNKDVTGKSYLQYKKAGVAYVPAARLEEGLIPGLTLTEHFILAEEQEGFVINRDHAVRFSKERISDFSIKGYPESRIEMLSGGNQQRALLALLRTPLDLLLLEHPTRGLDIESTIWIWHKLKERCKQGTSVVFISSDLEELLQYSDRILVFFGGRVSEPLDARKTTVNQLGELIGGKGWKE